MINTTTTKYSKEDDIYKKNLQIKQNMTWAEKQIDQIHRGANLDIYICSF